MKRFLTLVCFLVMGSPISFPPLQAAAAAGDDLASNGRAYGCLESTEDDWRRTCGGMVLTIHPEAEALDDGCMALGAGIVSPQRVAAAARSRRDAEWLRVDDSNPWSIEMSLPKSQGGIGSCSAFAIINALEALIPGKRFSTAELFLRMVTQGGASRADGGTSLHDYIALLSRGVVEETAFIPYDAYHSYVKRRSHLPFKLAKYEKFRESVEDLKSFCEDYADFLSEQGITVPHAASMRPIWREEVIAVRGLGLTPCIVTEGYWQAMKLNGFPLQVSRNSDFVKLLKYILRTVPVVISVHIFEPIRELRGGHFVMTVYKDAHNRDVTVDIDAWDHETLKSLDYIIDVPTSRPRPFNKEEKELGHENLCHAICLCGYDRSKGKQGAFRFKNSWKCRGTPDGKTWTWWGDEGYAWLTEEYIEAYTSSALVILPHPTELWIDRNPFARDADDAQTTAAFFRMLEDYRASTRR